MLCNYMRSIEVLLICVHFVASGPLRIASNGVDSVVLGGNEKALIIDTSTSFRGYFLSRYVKIRSSDRLYFSSVWTFIHGKIAIAKSVIYLWITGKRNFGTDVAILHSSSLQHSSLCCTLFFCRRKVAPHWSIFALRLWFQPIANHLYSKHIRSCRMSPLNKHSEELLYAVLYIIHSYSSTVARFHPPLISFQSPSAKNFWHSSAHWSRTLAKKRKLYQEDS